jgi:hypothetical protein
MSIHNSRIHIRRGLGAVFDRGGWVGNVEAIRAMLTSGAQKMVSICTANLGDVYTSYRRAQLFGVPRSG